MRLSVKDKANNFSENGVNFSGNVPIIYVKDMIQKVKKSCPVKCTYPDKTFLFFYDIFAYFADSMALLIRIMAFNYGKFFYISGYFWTNNDFFGGLIMG